jgi:signal transduction histidine kinase
VSTPEPEAARVGRLPALFISRVRAAVGCYMLALAVLGDPHLGYYPVAAWTLLLTAVGYAFVILAVRWRRSSRGWLVWILIGVDTIRFGLRRAAVALAWTVPLVVALIVLVPEPSRPGDQRARDAVWWTGHLIAGAVLAGVLADRLEVAHRRRSQAEADAAVERQRLELERDLRRRLESLDEGRRAFLSSLLHEFRPPVASLSTLARALRREEDLSADERTEMLERIDGHAHHLDVVLREVAEVLTSEALVAEHRLHQADIYLPQLVGEAASLSGLAPDRIVTRSQPGDNVVRSDPDKCLRVLVKLLEEAGRWVPPDGVIEVGIGSRDGLIELSVTPAGAAEDESLGLWIAARLAEAMGGGLTTETGPDGRDTVRATFGAQPPKRMPG